MSALNKEQFKNTAVSALDGSIDGSQTTLDVLDGSVFPATGDFHIRVEDEIMLCTARSTNTLTVVRGVEGSTPTSHADAISIAAKVTIGALETWGQNYLPIWANSSVLPLNTIVADDGVTVLDSSDFTWVNQGGASATDQSGTIVTRHPVTAASAYQVRALARTAPATPYSYIAALRMVAPSGTGSGEARAVFGFRKNSTGLMTIITFSAVKLSGAHKIAVLNFTDPNNVFNAARAETFMCINTPVIWLKIEDDGTNLKYYVGDGLAWILLVSVVRTVFITGGPDEILWGGLNHDNIETELLSRLVHWSRAS